MERLLVTGAAGNIGRMLRPLLRREGRILRLLDIAPIEEKGEEEGGIDEIVAADLTDPAAIADAIADVDAVLHLAGISVEAPFAEILRVNVAATAHLLEGARRAHVNRVLLASSNHAAGFYQRADAAVTEGLPDGLLPRPDTFYGWSKAAIESLGALYHHRFGMDIIALRIGTCLPQPPGTRELATWLSPADAARLVEACLTAPNPGFRIVWGVSDNRRRWWSLSGAASLGYESRDDAEVFAPSLIAELGEPDPTDPLHDFVGGKFCRAPLGEPMPRPVIPPRPGRKGPG